MLKQINISRGALRLWIVATSLWLVFVGFLTWDAVSLTTRGRYQYVEQLKDDLEPWQAFDGKRSITEAFVMPSASKIPASLFKIEYQYQAGFNDAAKAGTLKTVDFPDNSTLYIRAAYDGSDQNLISQWFWEQRWERRLDALKQEVGLILFGLIPPILLLLIWFVSRWVLAGFRRA